MKSSKRLACFGALVLALVLPHAPAWPQGPTPSIGAPAPTSPPAVLDRPTLVPDAGDPVDGDEVTLPAKPAAILSGSSTWDEGFAALKEAFQRIEDELAKAGIGPAGRPVTVFTQTDDDGFRYDAMLPIDRAPEDRPPNLSPDLRFGTTPSGRALRFVHRGPYDDIDSLLLQNTNPLKIILPDTVALPALQKRCARRTLDETDCWPGGRPCRAEAAGSPSKRNPDRSRSFEPSAETPNQNTAVVWEDADDLPCALALARARQPASRQRRDRQRL